MKKTLKRWLAPYETLFGYDVFISYAWDDGREYAEQLRDGLAKRGLTVFLDDDRIPVGEKLSAVAAALRRSSTLVAVITDASLVSEHVTEELISYDNKERPLIPVGTEQQITQLRDEPLLDYSEMGEVEHLDSSQRLQINASILSARIWIVEKNAVSLKVASKNTLDRLHRSVGFIRRDRILFTSMALVAAVLTLLTVFAWVQRSDAVTQRDIAVEQSQVAFARQLGAQAVVESSNRTDLSLLLAKTASDIHSDFQTDSSMSIALSNAGHVHQYIREHEGMVFDIQSFPDAKRYASIDMSGNIILFDDNNKKITSQALPEASARSLAILTNNRIAVGGMSGTVYIYSVPDLMLERELLLPFESQEKPSAYVAASKDGDSVIVGYSEWINQNGAIFDWQYKSIDEQWKPEFVHELNGPLISLATNNSAEKAAFVEIDGSVQTLIHTDTAWELDEQFNLPNDSAMPEVYVKAIGFSPNGDVLAVAAPDGRVVLFNMENVSSGPYAVCENHANDVYDLEISYDNMLLASVGADASLLLSDISSACEVLIRVKAETVPVMSVAFLENTSSRVITGSSRGVLIAFDLLQRSPRGVISKDEFDKPYFLRFDSAAESIVIGGSTGEDVGYVRKFRTTDGEPLTDALETFNQPFIDGKYLDSHGNFFLLNGLKLYQLQDGRLSVFKEFSNEAVSVPGNLYDGAGEFAVRVVSPSSVEIFNTKTGSISRSYDTSPMDFSIRSIALSTNGSLLAMGELADVDGRVLIYDIQSGNNQPLHEFIAHRLVVTTVQFDPEGGKLYTGSTDGRVLSWDITFDTPISTELGSRIRGVQRLAISGDGSWLAAGSISGQISLWDLTSNRLLEIPDIFLDGAVTALDFSADGSSLAAAAIGGSYGIWKISRNAVKEIICQLVVRDYTEIERNELSIPDEVQACG